MYPTKAAAHKRRPSHPHQTKALASSIRTALLDWRVRVSRLGIRARRVRTSQNVVGAIRLDSGQIVLLMQASPYRAALSDLAVLFAPARPRRADAWPGAILSVSGALAGFTGSTLVPGAHLGRCAFCGCWSIWDTQWPHCAGCGAYMALAA